MTRLLLALITGSLLIFGAAPPATAIPTCVTASMQTYIGFGSAGCGVESQSFPVVFTYSNFSYAGRDAAGQSIPPENVILETVDRRPWHFFRVATDRRWDVIDLSFRVQVPSGQDNENFLHNPAVFRAGALVLDPHFTLNPPTLDVRLVGSSAGDEFLIGMATPEPATLFLVGTTAAALGLARWRQRRRKQATVAP